MKKKNQSTSGNHLSLNIRLRRNRLERRAVEVERHSDSTNGLEDHEKTKTEMQLVGGVGTVLIRAVGKSSHDKSIEAETV